MLTLTIPYEDFNGQKKSRTAYFHLSRTEITRMTATGEIDPVKIEKALNDNDNRQMFLMLERFIASAYGVKSEDGSKFVKNEEVKKDFLESAAYDAFLMDLISDEKKAMRFITGIFPNDVVNELVKEMAKKDSVTMITQSAEPAADSSIPDNTVPEAPVVYDDKTKTDEAFEAAVARAVEERLRNANLDSNSK